MSTQSPFGSSYSSDFDPFEREYARMFGDEDFLTKENFSKVLRDIVDVTKLVAVESAKAISGGVEKAWDATSERAKEGYEKFSEGAKDTLQKTLNTLAKDPNLDNSTLKRIAIFAIQVAPVLGPTRQYARAREAFNLALQSGDESQLYAARKEALLSLGNVGFDIGMVAGGFMMQNNKTVTWLSRGIGAVFLGSRLVGKPIEPFSPLAERALERPFGIALADALLKFGGREEGQSSP